MAEKRHRPRISPSPYNEADRSGRDNAVGSGVYRSMRVTALVFGLLLSMSGVAAAQEWDEYTSLQDGFRMNFPGQPKVSDDHLDVAAELRPAGARVQRREGPRTLLGDRRRLQQHRAAGHRARQVVSARERQLPRQRARRRSVPATRITTSAARSSTPPSSCCNVTRS